MIEVDFLDNSPARSTVADSVSAAPETTTKRKLFTPGRATLIVFQYMRAKAPELAGRSYALGKDHPGSARAFEGQLWGLRWS